MAKNCAECQWLDMRCVLVDQGDALFTVGCFRGHWQLDDRHDEREFTAQVRAFADCPDFDKQFTEGD